MKRLAILVSALVIAASPAVAQDAPQTATLTAEGTGAALATPDTAIINIGVTSRAETPSEALAANSADMQTVIDTIRAAGVDEADISTSGFSISPIYPNNSSGPRPIEGGGEQPSRIVGYTVTNQVTVRIRDLDASGDVLDQVVAAGANQINGIRFDFAEPQPMQDEAMANAIADARRKAEIMAEAAGVELIRIISVSAYGGGPQPQFEMMRAANSVPIVAGEQAITANATITFEIGPR